MTTRPWDRQHGESGKAFEAFSIYRDLGAGRSIDAAWKRYANSDAQVSGYFRAWSAHFDWVERALQYDDYIEREARKKFEREAINRKVDMLKRHALAGKVLQRKGVEYIDRQGIDKSADAISAISKGIEIERKSEGLPDYLFEVMNADDNDLLRQYHELLASIGKESPETDDPEL